MMSSTSHPVGYVWGALVLLASQGLLSDLCQANAQTPTPNQPTIASAKKPDQPKTLDQFLDRLMVAESGGRLDAKNPRSSALGPFQFIRSTWLAVMESHFPDLAAKTSPAELLKLRTDPVVSRKAARAYITDLAAALKRADLKDSFVNLRLAYLLGPSGSIRVLQADDKQQVSRLVSRATLRANPFLGRLNVAGLKRRAKRDLSIDHDRAMNLKLGGRGVAKRKGPRIRVRCNLARPSCKRWLALQKRKARRRTARKKR